MSILIEQNESKRVDLLVCTPCQPVRMISAKLSGQISSLQSLWPENPKKFIYNGIELHEKMTFDFYGIRNGDSIIALPQDQNQNIFYKSQWINLTKDSDSFKESMNWIINPNTASEASRLRDLHMMKMENRPRGFNGLCTILSNNEQTKTKEIELKIKYVTPQKPSTKPLPILWETDK